MEQKPVLTGQETLNAFLFFFAWNIIIGWFLKLRDLTLQQMAKNINGHILKKKKKEKDSLEIVTVNWSLTNAFILTFIIVSCILPFLNIIKYSSELGPLFSSNFTV